MRALSHSVALLTATLLACMSAQALEPFKTYDSFSVPPIDPSRWPEREQNAAVKGGALNLMQRNWGLATANTGRVSSFHSNRLANPSAVTALKAKITVNALEANACPANPAPGESYARIDGSFFNTGSPVAGSQAGDVLALVLLSRASNSADAAGVLRVQGVVVACGNADCSAISLIGSVVDLGTVNVGQGTTVQMQWDRPGKRFKFSRDAAAFSGNVAYTQADANPPGVPYKEVSTWLVLPSCLSTPRVGGLVDASFDSIAVNSSAAP